MTTLTKTEPEPSTRAARTGFLLAALMLSTAVVTIDNTVLNVAVPTIGEHLHAGTNQLQWIVNAYSLLFGGLLMTAGSLADRLGRRRVLIGGLVAFGAASAAVVAVDTGPELIALRAVVGAAAAFVMPSTLAILMGSFAGRQRANAVGLWGAVNAAGFAAGPVLGGLLLDHFAWQSVFLINVPLALLALVGALRWVPATGGHASGRVDLAGTLLSVATMVAFVDTVVSGPVHGWSSATVLGSALATLVFGVGFVARELHTPHPMIDVRLLTRRVFAGPAAIEAALMFSVAGAMFLLTQHFQLVLGYSPLVAGLAVGPAALGVVVASPLVARLGARLSPRTSAALGLLLGAVSFTAMAALLRTGYLPLGLGLFGFGIGLRLALTPVALAVVDALPRRQAGMGSALNDTFQEIGGALGVALLGAIFNATYRAGLPDGLPGAAYSSLAGALGLHNGDVAHAARYAFDSGMQTAIYACAAVLAVVAVVAYRTIDRTSGD